MKFKIGDKYEYALPDGKDVTPKERIELVNEILSTVLDFDGEDMSVEEYLHFTWESNDDTKKVLNNFAYYTTIHHRTEEELKLEEEDRNTTYDKLNKRKTSTNGILSKNKEREMDRGFYVTKDTENKTKNVLKKRYGIFSNLDITNKNKLGVEQYKDNKDRKDSSESN